MSRPRRAGPARRGVTRTAAWCAVALAALLVCAAAAVLLVSTLGGGTTTPADGPAAASGTSAAPTTGLPLPAHASGQAPGQAPAQGGALAAAGGTLRLDALGVSAPVAAATVPDGVLTPPHDVHQVGIWTGGAPLDAATGTTVLAGHVNMADQGPGALYDLVTMEPGQVVHTVDAAGASTAWRVTAVTQRPKSDGVDETIWGGLAGPRRLVVVTCGGDLDYSGGVGDYRDNVYLYAEPVAEAPPAHG